METLNISDNGAIRIIELNRPQALNALNAQMTDDLCDAFLAATAAETVKVIVLTGAGKAFWAGADLKEMGGQAASPKHTFSEMLDAIIDCPKPFLLAVNGVGVGIGATKGPGLKRKAGHASLALRIVQERLQVLKQQKKCTSGWR